MRRHARARHHVYTVSAPLTGTFLRPDREVGDPVTANETIVAVMKPTAPSFHDPRMHQELQSALAAADAAVTLAEAERRRIEAALNYSRIELRRAQSLAGQGFVARSTLDKAVAETQTNEAALSSATAELQVRRNERDSAAARVQNPVGSTGTASDPGCCVQVRAPVSGEVLKLIQESEAVVPAGTPLIEIMETPQDLEIVAALLSHGRGSCAQARSSISMAGAVALKVGVRRVEPAGVSEDSALN